MNTTDVFEKNDHFSYTDIPDGLAVNGAAGEEIHFLNPVASAVFLLCDGAHDASAIAAILKEEFALAEPPIQDVLACLGELAAETLIRKVS